MLYGAEVPPAATTAERWKRSFVNRLRTAYRKSNPLVVYPARLTVATVDALINAAPRMFARSLRQHHLEIMFAELVQASPPDWDLEGVPQTAKSFEDLAFLFWSNRGNRKLIKQDFDEAAALFRTVRSLGGNATGVEVGRFKGGSTFLIAAALSPAGKLVSIDIDPRFDPFLRQALQRANLLDRVELLVADANTVAMERQLDFVFIDGDHSYESARKDHNKWAAKVRIGGYVIHHDMALSRPLATQFVSLARLRSDILSKQAGMISLAEERGSMAIFQRTSSEWVSI